MAIGVIPSVAAACMAGGAIFTVGGIAPSWLRKVGVQEKFDFDWGDDPRQIWSDSGATPGDLGLGCLPPW